MRLRSKRAALVPATVAMFAVLAHSNTCAEKPASAQATSAAAASPPTAGGIPECAGTAASPPAATTPTIPSRVFVDVSPTMAGFTGAGDRANVLRKLHQLIDTALGDAAAAPVKRCGVGAKWQRVKKPDCTPDEEDPNKCLTWAVSRAVDCESPVADWGAAYTYSALHETSKLDEVLAPKERPEKEDPDHRKASDLLDEAGITLVVASGIEPGAIDSGTAAPNVACGAGPGPGCITSSLLARARAGYGVWLVQVLAPFQGSFAADVPIDAKYKQAATAHVAALKLVAAGETTPYAGIDFKIGQQLPLQRKGLTFSSFQYTGVRPLLFFVLSRKVDAGRAFVKSFTDKVRNDPVLRPGKMAADAIVSSVELAPLARPKLAFASIDMLPADQQGLPPASLAEIRVKNKGATEKGAFAELWCGTQGKGWFEARWTSTPPVIALPAYIKTSPAVSDAFSTSTLSPTAISKKEGTDGSSVRVFVGCAALGPAPASPASSSGCGKGAGESKPEAKPVEYQLRAKTSLDEGAVAGEWWSKGSAPNSYEMPEKVYGLDKIVISVLKQTATRESCESRLRFNIERVQ